MDNYKIISALRDYCENIGIAFLSGDKFYQNYEASENSYVAGQLVMGAFFNCTPNFGMAGALTEIRYQGALTLGRKFDPDTTPSNLDETFIQKIDRRLEDLIALLAFHANAFRCENDLDLRSIEMQYKLNTFDTNIDFVSGAMTFIQ